MNGMLFIAFARRSADMLIHILCVQCVQCCWIKKINELKMFVYIPTPYSRVQYRCCRPILALDLPLTLNENDINLNIAWFIRIEKLASSSSNATKPSCPMDLCLAWKNKMQMCVFCHVCVIPEWLYANSQRWYWHSECVHYGLCGLAMFATYNGRTLIHSIRQCVSMTHHFPPHTTTSKSEYSIETMNTQSTCNASYALPTSRRFIFHH